MKEWTHHPSYTRARDRVVKRFRARVYSFKRLRPVVFLCGGFDSERRIAVKGYIAKYHPDVFVFFAEQVWEHVQELVGLNALEMESQLALLADLVVIIVESAGTFAELGAFATSEHLRQKLFAILDENYRTDRSFINTGPVKWLNGESRFAPVEYVDFATILLSAKCIDDRLSRIPDRGRRSTDDDVSLNQNPKHLLLLIADLITVVGPATSDQVELMIDSILGEKPVWSVPSLLGLAAAIGLIDTKHHDGHRFYLRAMVRDDFESFQARRMFDLAEERAKFLSAVQRIPQARQILYGGVD